MTLGERLKYCLKLRDMSQKQLADLVGVKLVNVNSYAKDRIKKPPIYVIEDYAKALKVNPAYLAGWSDNIDLTSDATGSYIPLFLSVPIGTTREQLIEKVEPSELTKMIPKPASLKEGHSYIAIKQDNDAMEPLYKVGDVLYIDITAPKIFNGSDVLVSVDYFNAKVNRIEFEDDKATLIPLNDKYPEKTIDLNKDTYTIIGPVVSFERSTEVIPTNKEEMSEYLSLEEEDPNYKEDSELDLELDE